MLRVNQLSGFSRRRFQAPRMRFVNSYALTYGGTINGTATIAVADLQYAPSPFRQLVVFACLEVPFAINMKVNGVISPMIWAGFAPTTVFRSAHTSNITIGVTLNGTSSEVGRILVYEVEYATDLEKSFLTFGTFNDVLIRDYELAMSEEGMGLLFAVNPTDTATHTLSGGMTKDHDADDGDMRGISGSVVTPVTVNTRIVSTLVSSAGDIDDVEVMGVRRLEDIAVGGGCFTVNALNPSGSTYTEVAGTTDAPESTGRGSCKLVIILGVRSTATLNSVTIGGVALTRIAQAKNSVAAVPLSVEIWTIDLANDVPSGNIVYTMSGAPGQILVLNRLYLYDAARLGTPQGITGNGTGSAVSVDVAQGGMIVAATLRDQDTQTVTWTGVQKTDEFSQSIAPFFTFDRGHRANCDAQTGRTVQAVGSISGQYATLAMAFNP